MPIEDKIRRVGTKSVTYPWLRRFVVIGPYNRKVRQDAAAGVLGRVLEAAARTASGRVGRHRGKGKRG